MVKTSVKKIVTHSGRFHTDETFGVAVLKIVFPGAQIVRTRDHDEIESADIVLDVGGVYSEETDRFDHHQTGGAGVRENGIPYASLGLVWKKYGALISGSSEVVGIIEKNIVVPIDAMDNGVDISTPIFSGVRPFIIQDILFLFSPTWQEKELTYDEAFFEALTCVEKILKRAIVQAEAEVLGNTFVRQAYQNAQDKRIIELGDKYSYQNVLSEYTEPLFIIVPDSQSGNWKVETLVKKQGTFEPRKKFPENWAGKRDQELQKETGVSDAVFCHNARFMAVAQSKEGALKLAELALKD